MVVVTLASAPRQHSSNAECPFNSFLLSHLPTPYWSEQVYIVKFSYREKGRLRNLSAKKGDLCKAFCRPFPSNMLKALATIVIVIIIVIISLNIKPLKLTALEYVFG